MSSIDDGFESIFMFLMKALLWALGALALVMLYEKVYYNSFIPWLNYALHEDPSIPVMKTFTTAMALIGKNYIEFFLIFGVPALATHFLYFKGDSQVAKWVGYFFLVLLALFISDTSNRYVNYTKPYPILLLTSLGVFTVLALVSRLGVRSMWIGWPRFALSTIYFSIGGACALIVNPWYFLGVVALFVLVYGQSLLGAYYYLFVRHPAEPIVTPALTSGAAINHNALADELEKAMASAGGKGAIYNEDQALKAKALRDKLDADAELAAATVRRERARAAAREAEEDFKTILKRKHEGS